MDIARPHKELTKRTGKSEYPYRVQSYQFKELDAEREFSKTLAGIKNSGHRHLVQAMHRRLEITTHGAGGCVVVPILLDVTTDSLDEAEAQYARLA